MVQQIIVFLLGLYLLGESIYAAALMPGGDRICRVAKYLVTGMVGIGMMIDPSRADAMHIAMGIALALFIFQKTKKRIEVFIDQFMGDGHA